MEKQLIKVMWSLFTNSFLVGVFCVSALMAGAQNTPINLVPNGDFNYPEPCTPGSGTYEGMTPWFASYDTPDKFHPCFTSTLSVPDNAGGWEHTYSGEGYVGLATFATANLKREFISVELTEPLVAGVAYHGRFHVSRSDSCWYATKQIGMYLSTEYPSDDINHLFSVVPQVTNTRDSIIVESDGWTRIEKSFIAVGGERYLTMGNFNDDEHTDTLSVPGGGVAPFPGSNIWKYAYYYIDGVSLIPDSVYLEMEEVEKEHVFKLYPNPNAGAFTLMLSVEELDRAEILIWNVSGQQVHRGILHNGMNDLNLDVAEGLYVYNITLNGVPKWTGKISITSD